MALGSKKNDPGNHQSAAPTTAAADTGAPAGASETTVGAVGTGGTGGTAESSGATGSGPATATSTPAATTEPAPAKPAKPSRAAKRDAEPAKSRKNRGAAVKSGADQVRRLLAQAVWLVAALFALVLAIGALLVAVDQTNRGNDLVQFILDAANAVDFGVFDRRDGVMKFEGKSANALVNWGLAAVVWLVLGRIADRLIRP